MPPSGTIDDYYPVEPCPFCAIATTFPFTPRGASSGSSKADLLNSVPDEATVKAREEAPALRAVCFPVLASENVLAFLDIMPMVRGHLLVASRNHRRKVGEMTGAEAAEIGYWLPIISRVISKVTGCPDYNIVQNNGARAAQVVPHVHFHVIPRENDLRTVDARSWTMFGKGLRDDLEDSEGHRLAREIRAELRDELRKVMGEKAAL